MLLVQHAAGQHTAVPLPLHSSRQHHAAFFCNVVHLEVCEICTVDRRLLYPYTCWAQNCRWAGTCYDETCVFPAAGRILLAGEVDWYSGTYRGFPCFKSRQEDRILYVGGALLDSKNAIDLIFFTNRENWFKGSPKFECEDHGSLEWPAAERRVDEFGLWLRHSFYSGARKKRLEYMRPPPQGQPP